MNGTELTSDCVDQVTGYGWHTYTDSHGTIETWGPNYANECKLKNHSGTLVAIDRDTNVSGGLLLTNGSDGKKTLTYIELGY